MRVEDPALLLVDLGGGSSMDVATVTELLREAQKGHGEYEATAPKHHWSEWYAVYIGAREQLRSPEEAAKDAALHMERARQSGPRGARIGRS